MPKDPFISCRTFGHAWETFTPTFYRPGNRTWKYRISLLCIRCGTERHDGIDGYGDVASRYYLYPEGYSYLEDEMPTRSEFRLMMLKD